MGLTSSGIEEFISRRITRVTRNGMTDVLPHLPAADTWISTIGICNVLGGAIPEENRALVLQVVRRTEAALKQYSLARAEVQALVEGPPRWSPYYRALTHVESSIQFLYQARYLAGKRFGLRQFEKGDGSASERLNVLYNAIKHNDALEEDSVWLTNDGIECKGGAVTYGEFEELLARSGALAESLVARSL